MTERKVSSANAILAFAVLALVVGLLATLLVAVHTPSTALKVIGTALLVELACVAVGALVGFLFGIPRSVSLNDGQIPGVEDGRKDGQRYRVNTNLEQISDWLTKILVGIGLVQLGTIKNFGSELINRVADDLGPDMRSLAGGLIISSVTTGFVSGYLLTRTVLAKTFSEYDALTERVYLAEKTAARAEQISSQVAKDVEALAAAEAILAGDDETTKNVSELVRTFRGANSAVLAQIFSRARLMRAMNWRTSKSIVARTTPIFKALTLVDDARTYHRNFGELGYALKDQEPPDWIGAEKALSEAIRIRDSRGELGYRMYEYNRALCRVVLDANRANSVASGPSTREAIVNDLRAATENGVVRRERLIESDERIKAWLVRNDVDLTEIISRGKSGGLDNRRPKL